MGGKKRGKMVPTYYNTLLNKGILTARDIHLEHF